MAVAPLQVDPLDYDKEAATLQALALCSHFCDANGIERPAFREQRCTPDYGYYEPRVLRVNYDIHATKRPTIKPGYAWSFTGFKADLTTPGVIAHEVGHHVWFMRHVDARALREYVKGEPRVSSYEPNTGEVFAEAARLFILNPDLLKQGRPRRFSFFADVLSLKPVVTLEWWDVLLFAHPRIVKAAENWMAKR